LPELLRPTPEFARIALLTCDVDGVLTDGGLYYGADGQTHLRFSVLDGMGLKLLRAAGVKVCFITQGKHPAVAARAAALGIDYCLMGIEDKVPAMNDLLSTIGIDMSSVCHIADDINDLGLLNEVGLAVTVPNAVGSVKSACHFVTLAGGGHGAVRELCDAIVQARASLS
jgi:3-deoxy-D-manno-octulosonate 8-phosphate phosphatase (KDO 8-P phosphatase)